MKKYILALFFAFLCFQINYGQNPEGPPGCPCCAGLSGTLLDPNTPLGACFQACEDDDEGDYCDSVVPIDSNIFLLLGLAISLGGYSVYQNKKRLAKN